MAAGAAGSASGGAAGANPSPAGNVAAALPAMFGGQRFAMYSRLGQSDEADAKAALEEPDWMSGKFGLLDSSWFGESDGESDGETSSAPSGDASRRMLLALVDNAASSGNATDVNASGAQRAPLQMSVLLQRSFTDRLLSLILCFCVCICLQYLLLTCWLLLANRRYYRWKAENPQAVAALEKRRAEEGDEVDLSARLRGKQARRTKAIMRRAEGLQAPPRIAPHRCPPQECDFKPPPRYRSLPSALLWPNMEVLVILIFSGGLTESATAVLGALAGGVLMPTWSIVLSCAWLFLLALVLVSQLRRIALFYRAHATECWLAFEAPTRHVDVHDPLLAVLCRLRLIAPRSRDKGAFLVPADDASEPQRTELALAEAFNCGLGYRRRIARAFFGHRVGHYAAHDKATAGKKLERLQVWIGDGSASCAGMAFQVVRVAIQLCVSVNTGFLFAHPFRATSSGQQMQLSLNVALLAIAAVFTGVGTASDLWNGLATSMGYVLESCANALILASVLARSDEAGVPAASNATPPSPDAMLDVAPNATMNSTLAVAHARVESVVMAVQLAGIAATMLRLAVLAPLLLVVYDAIVVPLVSHVRKQDAGTPLEVGCSLMIALVVVPLQAARVLLGLNRTIADLIDEYKESIEDVASRASVGVASGVADAVHGDEEALADVADSAFADESFASGKAATTEEEAREETNGHHALKPADGVVAGDAEQLVSERHAEMVVHPCKESALTRGARERVEVEDLSSSQVQDNMLTPAFTPSFRCPHINRLASTTSPQRAFPPLPSPPQ